MKFATKAKPIIIKNTRKNAIDPVRKVWLSADGVFGVHEHFEYAGEFVLTHMRTGIKFPYEFGSRKDAYRFANAIVDVADWKALKIVAKDGKGKIVPEATRLTIGRECNAIYTSLFGDGW